MNKTDIFKIIKSIKGYQTSLKHDSYDKRQKNSNKPFQKYEFLGDRVLGLVISEYLINNFSNSSLDEISRRFIHLVNTSMLAKIFKKYDLIEIFKHQLDPKSSKNSIYADALESLIEVSGRSRWWAPPEAFAVITVSWDNDDFDDDVDDDIDDDDKHEDEDENDEDSEEWTINYEL